MGRKPRAGDKAAEEMLRVKMTGEELAALDTAAAKAGVDRSAYVRLALAGWMLLHPPRGRR